MPAPCDLLLTADLLLPQDDARSEIADAAVAIAGGRVAALGPAAVIVPAFVPRRRLDLGRALILPGLVNAHTHAAMTMFRGLADDLPLLDWLHSAIFPVEARLTPAAVRLGARIACAEMTRVGVTCFLDGYLFSDEVLAAADDAGLRCVAGEGLFAFPNPAFPDASAALAHTRARAGRLADNERLRQCVLPHAIYTTTPEIMRAAWETAGELGIPFVTHLAESPGETAQVMRQHGARPVEYMRRHGLLGARALFAHCVDLSPEEIDILAASGSAVAHCPESNAKLASGFAPTAAMLRAGVVVGLGTDGPASNNDLNMFGEMNAAALTHKGNLSDPTAVNAAQALDMATRGAAEAIGWPELGRLTAGGPADLVALDLDKPNMQPLHRPVSQLVYAATGFETRLTVCAGRVLYEDGAYAAFDSEELLVEAADLAAWVRSHRP